MPQFRYTATNAQGKTVRGMADAPSEEALYTKLRDDGLYMSEALQTKRVRSTFRPLKTAVLADFCRNLGTLLTAGVPLVRAFRIMADERSIDPQQRALYEAVLGELARQGLAVPALTLGIPDTFVPQGSTNQLLHDLGLDAEGIAASVQERLAR